VDSQELDGKSFRRKDLEVKIWKIKDFASRHFDDFASARFSPISSRVVKSARHTLAEHPKDDRR